MITAMKAPSHTTSNFYNHLLLKDQVGKSKPTTRDLPGDKFTYGKPDVMDKEGASQVTTSWQFH